MIFSQVENTAITDTLGTNLKSIYTRGLWDRENGVAELLNFYTSSLQGTSSKRYYYEVWSSASLECDDERMFSVAYGHIAGSGSKNEGGEINDTPSRAIYSQYKLSCLDGDEEGIYISGSNGFKKEIKHFYVININQDKFGDKLDPGNFEINLAELNGGDYANNVFTGSNVQVSSSGKVISLIDDSNDASNFYEFSDTTSVPKNIVSGTLLNGIHNGEDPHYYGVVYPDRGVILLDADALNVSASFNTVGSSSLYGDNSYKLFTSISGAASNKTVGFTARAVDVRNTHYVFIRVRNTEFNYSNNPTYVTGSQDQSSKGKIRHQMFVESPYTYITSIGLYNNQQPAELIAVGKLSQPIIKSPNSELIITVRLVY